MTNQQAIQSLLTHAQDSRPQWEYIESSIQQIPNWVEKVLACMQADENRLEGYRLLMRLRPADAIPKLYEMLNTSNDSLRTYVIYLLMAIDSNPDERLVNAVSEWSRTFSFSPQTQKECFQILKAAKFLQNNGRICDQLVVKLRAVLFFVPQKYSEAMWPKTWIEAARILWKTNHAEKLHEVLNSSKPHYLSTVGAIALYNDGVDFMRLHPHLKDTKDHPWLTEAEKKQVVNIMQNDT